VKGRVIRGGGGARRARPAATRVLPRRQQLALAEAEQLVQQASARAEQIARDAADRAEAAEATRRRRAEDDAAELLVAASAQAAAITSAARAQLTELAVTIAAKLLGAELQLAPQRVTLIVSEAIATSAGKHLLLRLHPADAQQLTAELERLRARHEVATLRLTPDSTISRGGCVIESEVGQTDARLETRLELVRRALAAGEEER